MHYEALYRRADSHAKMGRSYREVVERLGRECPDFSAAAREAVAEVAVLHRLQSRQVTGGSFERVGSIAGRVLQSAMLRQPV